MNDLQLNKMEIVAELDYRCVDISVGVTLSYSIHVIISYIECCYYEADIDILDNATIEPHKVQLPSLITLLMLRTRNFSDHYN